MHVLPVCAMPAEKTSSFGAAGVTNDVKQWQGYGPSVFTEESVPRGSRKKSRQFASAQTQAENLESFGTDWDVLVTLGISKA